MLALVLTLNPTLNPTLILNLTLPLPGRAVAHAESWQLEGSSITMWLSKVQYHHRPMALHGATSVLRPHLAPCATGGGRLYLQ